MEYREYEVPAVLARHVRCVWRLRGPSLGRVETVYPDGCCELIAHLGAPMLAYTRDGDWRAQPVTLFAAQQRAALRLKPGGDFDCLGIRLMPAASACLAGENLPHWRDTVQDLAAIAPAFSAAFSHFRHGSGLDLGAAFWAWLRAALPSHELDERIEQAVLFLEEAQGLLAGAELTAGVGMSLRALQSHFLARVGLSIKEFGRILRLQATIRRLDQGEAPLADIAASAGFSDQAHATRELREHLGLTPARLYAALRAGREEAQTLRLAAAFVRGHGGPRHGR